MLGDLVLTETEKVERWRLEELLRADYPVMLADELASRLDIDLHRAIKLVTDGCAPELAAQILL